MGTFTMDPGFYVNSAPVWKNSENNYIYLGESRNGGYQYVIGRVNENSVLENIFISSPDRMEYLGCPDDSNGWKFLPMPDYIYSQNLEEFEDDGLKFSINCKLILVKNNKSIF